tara:strand:- start:185 stop:505 length:321 start_codon:yes stop_codon:yes gene_type:complete
MKLKPEKEKIFEDKNFLVWKKRWKERLLKNNNTLEKSIKLMREHNPLVIPRNFRVEQVLNSAEDGDLKPLKKFLSILAHPYTDQKNISEFQKILKSKEKYQTFCGT